MELKSSKTVSFFDKTKKVKQRLVSSASLIFRPHIPEGHIILMTWVRGLMTINVGCEIRDRGSIPSV